MPEQIIETLESLGTFWNHFLRLLPQLAIALLVLIPGWLIAKFLRKIIIRLLKLLRIDEAAEKGGVEKFLLAGGVEYTTVTIIANMVYWFLMFAVILAVANSLGLRGTDEMFAKIVQYIPNVAIAVIVLIFGILFAKFVNGVLSTYLSNVGVRGADFIGYVAQWALIIFVVSIAFEQLSIGGLILVSAFQIAFGALCLALALAFGLGGREWAARILEKLWKK